MPSLTVSFLCFWNDLHRKFDLVNYSGFQINLVETLADFFCNLMVKLIRQIIPSKLLPSPSPSTTTFKTWGNTLFWDNSADATIQEQ